MSERKAEYKKLTKEEREKMVCLFEESKATQTTARRIKMVSRINDISATMLAIENEVPSLLDPSMLLLSSIPLAPKSSFTYRC